MSNARFQEIIEVVLDSTQAEKDAAAFIKSWKSEISKMFRGKELPQGFKAALDEADKALKSMLDSQERARISSIKKAATAEVAEEKRKAEAIKRINEDIRRADAQRRKEEERENIASVERQMAAVRRAALEQERLNARLVRNQIRATRPTGVAAGVGDAEAKMFTSNMALRGISGGLASIGQFRGAAAVNALSSISSQAGMAQTSIFLHH